MHNDVGKEDLFSKFEITKHSQRESNGETLNGEVANDEIASLKKQIEDLTKKNNQLTRLVRIFKDQNQTFNSHKPSIQILYYDDKYSRVYKDVIENFIAGLISSPLYNDKLPLLSNRPNFINITDAYENEERIMLIGSSKFYKEMIIDRLGWPLNGDDVYTSTGWTIPRFMQTFNCAYPDPDYIENEFKLPQRNKNLMNCFNCGGPHSVQQCPEKKDFLRIAANRNKFNSERNAQNQLNTPQLNNEYYNAQQKFDIAIKKEPNLEDIDYRSKTRFKPPSNYMDMPNLPYTTAGFTCPPPSMLSNNHNHMSSQLKNRLGPIKQPFLRPIHNSHSRKRSPEYKYDDIAVKQIKLEPSNDMDIDDSEIVNGEIKEFEAITPLHSTSTFSSQEDNENLTPFSIERSHLSLSKSFELGTPIALDLSNEEGLIAYKELPDSNKFSVGISDHINFENMPGSTGAYEKMKELFKLFKR